MPAIEDSEELQASQQGSVSNVNNSVEAAEQILPRQEGMLHFLLGRTYEQKEEWMGSFFELRMAIPFFADDEAMLQEIEKRGRKVAANIRDTHKVINVLLEDIDVVKERRENPEPPQEMGVA
ncbi:unnamed protein product [Amoebophrya sp. A25]|nr:unnamed protein product [Amoebophrya sp. A25]|eukprot:GSA25T00013102001.1